MQLSRERKEANELSDSQGEGLIENIAGLCEDHMWESDSALNGVSLHIKNLVLDLR